MVPRKVGSAWEINAPAKLNLYLEVLGKRDDGFHEMETLIVPVRIHDQLFWHPSPERVPSLSRATESSLLSVVNSRGMCFEQLADSPEKQNLVTRAVLTLAESAGRRPRGHFQLVKRIPTEAGMGGGSSDAAAALLLANACWNLRYSRDRLVQLAATLGSDVPFFLAKGPAICRGRGERIESLRGLPRLHFVLVMPPGGLSTAAIFRSLQARTAQNSAEESASRLSTLVHHLRRGAVFQAASRMSNRLEAVAVGFQPVLRAIRHEMLRAGCAGAFMTGSGSAYVGIARSAVHARRIARMLTGTELGTVLASTSC